MMFYTKDGTIGKVGLVHSMPDKATLAAGLFRLRARKEIWHGFVLCLLNSYLFDCLIWSRRSSNPAPLPNPFAFKFAIPGNELMIRFEEMVGSLIERTKNT